LPPRKGHENTTGKRGTNTRKEGLRKETLATATERKRQISKYRLVKQGGKYYAPLLGQFVPYGFGRRCLDRKDCKECYGCFAGCNCGCSIEEAEQIHVQLITGHAD
jgi:hypothetical protein